MPSNGLDTVFAQEVWDQFFPQLAQFARKKLGTLPRRDVDEEDVAISAINSFFCGVEANRFKFEERDDLWKILATIAVRKAIAHKRKYFSQKRGNGKTRGESVFEYENDEIKTGLDQIADVGRMPEIPDRVFDSCEELLSSLKNEMLRQTALLRMQGFSNEEISKKLDCSIARTKQRLTRIKQQWQSVFDVLG